MEIIFFGGMCLLIVLLIVKLFNNIISRKHFDNDLSNISIIIIFFILCAIILIGTYNILITVASFDVVNDRIYIIFYLVMALAYVYIHMVYMNYLLGISILDDVFNNSNKASLIVIFSSLIGLSTIFAAANIGDGPGFYTVVVAHGLGMIAYGIIMYIFDLSTRTLEHVQSDHNYAKAIRYAVFVLSLSSILAYGAQGDWTSFNQTIVEFFVAWPAIILLGIGILLENIFKKVNSYFVALLISSVYIIFTVYAFKYLIPAFDFVELIMGAK